MTKRLRRVFHKNIKETATCFLADSHVAMYETVNRGTTMPKPLSRLNLLAIAILLGTISISVNAHAQTPSAGGGGPGGTAVTPEFRLSDLLARAERGRGHTTSVTSSWTAIHGSASAAGPFFNITPAAAGASLPVTGSGTVGRVTKWVSFGNTSVIGDTTIFEDKNGRVGVGTDTPTSKLSVVGTIESSSGGFKFPDGSVQTASAAGSLFSVTTMRHSWAGHGGLAPVASPPEFATGTTRKTAVQAELAEMFGERPYCNSRSTVPAGKQLVIGSINAWRPFNRRSGVP
jgi:hypothetical protein